MMNATLQDIFIDSGASYYTKAWDVYDLWGNRTNNATAQAIMNRMAMSTFNGTQPPGNLAGYYNATQMSHAQGLAANNTRLYGTMIGTVQAQWNVERDDPEAGDWVLSLEDEPDGELEEGRVVGGSPLLRENAKGIRIA